ncbi:MAG: ChaN family lipoprotein [Kastovskya adunca ATA6-11-RM4]|jgi:uncharacterized iron-regulated protein|nr:ChaN family lipoprotein [Kastovskya adunca ATA6-11-RM4]
MKTDSITQLCAWSLGVVLLLAAPADAQRIFSPVQQQSYRASEIYEELEEADVVYLGETHDSPEDHKAQLAIIQALYQQQRKKNPTAPPLAIALEMFQRPYQDILNQYLAGEITEAQLIEQSEYDDRWGFPWEYYAPILRFAKANQLPVIALNTPTEITRKVARQGLESLSAQERRYIPPASEICTDNVDYRQRTQEIFEQHQVGGHGNSADFEKFFLALVLWDETMAEAIAQFMQTNPDYQVVVLAGQSHIAYGDGIPSRVERRINNPNLTQRSILLGASEELQVEKKAIADFLWQH